MFLVACGGASFSPSESLVDSGVSGQAGSAGASGQNSAGSAGQVEAGVSGQAGTSEAGSAGQGVAGISGQAGTSDAGAGSGGQAGQSGAGSAGSSGQGQAGSAEAGQGGAGQAGTAGQGGAGSSGQAGQSGGSGSAPGSVVPDAIAMGLIGSYAVKKHSTKKVTPSNMSVVFTVTYDTYGLATIERNGVGLKITETVCHTDVVTDSSSFTMKIPDAVLVNTPAIVAPFRAWFENGTPNFARDEAVVVLGAELSNPKTDTLPLNPTDATVRDSDKDGHPGVTSNITLTPVVVNGWTHSVQRQISSYAGTTVTSGKLTGEYFYTSEQTVLESSDMILQNSWKQTGTTGVGMNTVTFVSLLSRNDCTSLMAQKDSIPW